MSEIKKRVVVLAAGGTGGHMFPAQSLAEEFAARDWEIVLTTDRRGLRYADGFEEEISKYEFPSASFSQGSLGKRLSAPFKILKGYQQARQIFKEKTPSAVIGFGGYPSLPSLMAARAMKIPYFIHEQNAVLGRVNRRFQNQARMVACGLWPVKFSKQNAVFIGNPVRESVLKNKNTPLPKGEDFSILVFGGSQGASALSEIVPYAVSLLPEELRNRLQITQQVREGEIKKVEEEYNAAKVNCELAPFFEDMPERIAKAHLVISRAGASTIAELETIGRGSILIPLPSAANDHQRANAEAMVKSGAALEYDEALHHPEALALWLQDLLTSPDRLETMAENAYNLARPEAACSLVDLIEKDLHRGCCP